MAPRNDYGREAEKVVLTYDHGALTATTTVKLYKVPAGRTLRVDRVSYINPTGLVEDNANNFAGAVNNGATVVATLFNTDANLDPDTGATLAVDTFVEGTLATSADCVLAAADILSFVATETGTATLPAGHLVIEGRLF